MDNYFSARDILEKAIGTDAYFQIKSILFGLKAADVAPVVHARWVRIYESGEPAIEQHQVGVCCSRCMKMPKDKFTETDYCPNCGAKMDG